MTITLLRPAGLVASRAFSHVAIVPSGATTIYIGDQKGIDASGSVVLDRYRRAIAEGSRQREHRSARALIEVSAIAAMMPQ